MLIITRFFSGAFAVITLTVHFAYISDKSCNENKPKYLMIATLFLPLGIFFGYTIGGFLGDLLSPRATFMIQAIISLGLALILYNYIDSASLKRINFRKIKWNILKEDYLLLKRNTDTCLNYTLIITFLNIVSYQLFISQATVILNSGFKETSSFIGIFVAIYNLIAAGLSIFVQRKLNSNSKENHRYLSLLSLLSIGCSGIALLSIFGNVIFLWLGLMLATIFNTIFLSFIQTILTRIDIHNEIGALIGINQAVQSLGIFTGAFCGGILVSKMLFAPIIMAMCAFLITFIINRFVVSREIDASLMKLKDYKHI
jgi:predicted MFS family arabinose efflux permease